MTLADLARRLAATTMFSPLPKRQLDALLQRSPLRQGKAGAQVEDTPRGLRNHVVLLSGEVEATRSWTAADGSANSYSRRITVAADGPGFELISAASSQLRLTARTDVDYLAIDSDDLDELLGWDYLGAFVLPEPHLKIFHRLPLDFVAKAINRLVEKPVAAGEVIVTQGEPAFYYYVILSGEAEVWETDPQTGKETLVNCLSDGDSFGEHALLTESTRTATVKMRTPGSLLMLRRSDFDKLLRAPLVEVIEAAAARAKVLNGTARLLDCRHPAERAEGYIPGSMQMPLERLRHEGVFSIERDKVCIVYCRNGRRSRAAAFLLRERGIKALSLVGGIAEWPYELEVPHA